MDVKYVVVGPLETNCYILEISHEVLIIDPGDDAKTIKNKISNDKKVIGIIVTHSHFDHIGALDELLKFYKTKLYNMSNLSEGNHTLGSFSFEVIYTPGHMNDAITIYFKDKKLMFVGDFIFKGSIGRTDMSGASPKDMKESIKKILRYPMDTVLYPGHYDKTTLEEEIITLNYFYNIL